MQQAMPSLKRIVLLKVAAYLWNQKDVWASTPDFLLPILDEQITTSASWLSVENMVIERAPKFPLPESLKMELLRVIKPVGHEILRWKVYHYRSCNLRIDLSCEFYWALNGMIDQKKTAEALINDDSLDIIIRYKLACVCCLENYIKQLWNKMSKNQRKSFYSKENSNSIQQHDLVIYWTYVIKEELSRVRIERGWDEFEYYLFKIAAHGGNKVATEYFLQKLIPEQREVYLFNIAKEILSFYPFDNCCNSDVVCFILSQLNEDQQRELFKRRPYEVLLCFLDWPYQSLFTEKLNHVWDFLSEWDYKDLLQDIVHKVIYGYKDYDYQMLFANFWQQNFVNKRFDINTWTFAVLLPQLFKAVDEKSIRLILNDATFVKKHEFILSSTGKKICNDLIFKDKWNLVRFFVEECITSKELIVQFRKECEECDTWFFRKNSYSWDKFFHLLDDFIEFFDKKRNIEESYGSPEKRLCSTENKKRQMV